jgi:hypothetical protein
MLEQSIVGFDILYLCRTTINKQFNTGDEVLVYTLYALTLFHRLIHTISIAIIDEINPRIKEYKYRALTAAFVSKAMLLSEDNLGFLNIILLNNLNELTDANSNMMMMMMTMMETEKFKSILKILELDCLLQYHLSYSQSLFQ